VANGRRGFLGANGGRASARFIDSPHRRQTLACTWERSAETLVRDGILHRALCLRRRDVHAGKLGNKCIGPLGSPPTHPDRPHFAVRGLTHTDRSDRFGHQNGSARWRCPKVMIVVLENSWEVVSLLATCRRESKVGMREERERRGTRADLYLLRGQICTCYATRSVLAARADLYLLRG
jgi:hypothetical protein